MQTTPNRSALGPMVLVVAALACACGPGGSTPDGGAGGGLAAGGGPDATGGGGWAGGGSPGGASSGGGEAGGGSGTGGHGADGGWLACPELAQLAEPRDQVAVVEGDLTCAGTLVTLLEQQPARYATALGLLAASPLATEAVFSVVYDELRADRLRFDSAGVDALFAQLAPQLEGCTGNSRCADWRTFVLGRLETGNMYRCPPTAGATEAELLATVPYGDYQCIEGVIPVLAPLTSQSTITALLSMVESHVYAWARRNAERVLGRFAGRTGDAVSTLVVVTMGTAVTTSMSGRLSSEVSDDVLSDAIWILDSYFYPYFAMEPQLRALTADVAHGADVRFRAISAMQRLYWASSGLLPAVDVTFLESSIASDEMWVRAEAAYACHALRSDQLDASSRARLVASLQRQYGVEPTLTAKVDQAQALDGFDGTALEAALRAETEASLLPVRLDAGMYSIRAGLDAGTVASLMTLLTDEEAAFLDVLGLDFRTPVLGDPNLGLTLNVFATNAEYQDYMNAFVGDGAYAGGMYVESTGQLYTYQRTPQESVYTLEELVQHEFGHALQGRYVYPGVWGDQGYFAQPRAWADEGLAEVMAGLSFDGGTYQLHGRASHVTELCAAPLRTLDSLLAQRVGYDEPGVFDYAGGWAFAHFLLTSHRPEALRLYRAWRSGTYTLADFATIAQVSSVDELDSAWHGTVAGWCANGAPGLWAPRRLPPQAAPCGHLQVSGPLPHPGAPRGR